jgi:hypothetical protein
MMRKKTPVTKKHIAAVKKAIMHFKTKHELCKFLEVSSACGHQWEKGMRVISLDAADKLANAGIMSFLKLRPDMEKYRKHFE